MAKQNCLLSHVTVRRTTCVFRRALVLCVLCVCHSPYYYMCVIHRIALAHSPYYYMRVIHRIALAHSPYCYMCVIHRTVCAMGVSFTVLLYVCHSSYCPSTFTVLSYVCHSSYCVCYMCVFRRALKSPLPYNSTKNALYCIRPKHTSIHTYTLFVKRQFLSDDSHVYGVATMRRLLKITSLFCKRAL